jgi:hypothetical protein
MLTMNVSSIPATGQCSSSGPYSWAWGGDIISFLICQFYLHDRKRDMCRWVHTQPWNSRAQYSLILTLQQQMQQQKQVCQMIYRMACNQFAAIASDPVMGSILQVCASDAALRLGDTASALQHAKAASELSTSNLLYHLFASFQLARCYAATENHQLLHMELKKCHRNTSSDDLLGLLKLAELEDQAGSRDLRSDSFEHAVQMKGGVDQGLWMALWWLGHAQTFLEAQDYLSAEKAAAKAVTFHSGNPILHLFHGTMPCLCHKTFLQLVPLIC